MNRTEEEARVATASPRAHIDRVLDVLTGASGPAEAAAALGVDVDTVLEWCRRICVAVPMVAPGPGTRFRGVEAEHTVARSRRDDADLLIFTVTVRNRSRFRFHAVRVIQRSFTDQTLRTLGYDEPWLQTTGRTGVVEPGETVSFRATYPLSPDQLGPDADIVNAVYVVGMTASGAWFRKERDALWPVPEWELSEAG